METKKAKKPRTKREKKPKKTDAQVAADLRAKADTFGDRAQSVRESADIIEKLGRKGLRLYQHLQAAVAKVERLKKKCKNAGVFDVIDEYTDM
jgi:hypothetical protein